MAARSGARRGQTPMQGPVASQTAARKRVESSSVGFTIRSGRISFTILTASVTFEGFGGRSGGVRTPGRCRVWGARRRKRSAQHRLRPKKTIGSGLGPQRRQAKPRGATRREKRNKTSRGMDPGAASEPSPRRRAFCTSGPAPLPSVEYDSIATRGVRPKAAAVSALVAAIWARSWGVLGGRGGRGGGAAVDLVRFEPWLTFAIKTEGTRAGVEEYGVKCARGCELTQQVERAPRRPPEPLQARPPKVTGSARVRAAALQLPPCPPPPPPTLLEGLTLTAQSPYTRTCRGGLGGWRDRAWFRIF
jgi:hypothetical protein